MAQVRAARMLVVHKYDLFTDVDRHLVTLEMILRCSIAEMDTDVNTCPLQNQRCYAQRTLPALWTSGTPSLWLMVG